MSSRVLIVIGAGISAERRCPTTIQPWPSSPSGPRAAEVLHDCGIQSIGTMVSPPWMPLATNRMSRPRALAPRMSVGRPSPMTEHPSGIAAGPGAACASAAPSRRSAHGLAGHDRGAAERGCTAAANAPSAVDHLSPRCTTMSGVSADQLQPARHAATEAVAVVGGLCRANRHRAPVHRDEGGVLGLRIPGPARRTNPVPLRPDRHHRPWRPLCQQRAGGVAGGHQFVHASRGTARLSSCSTIGGCGLGDWKSRITGPPRPGNAPTPHRPRESSLARCGSPTTRRTASTS